MVLTGAVLRSQYIICWSGCTQRAIQIAFIPESPIHDPRSDIERTGVGSQPFNTHDSMVSIPMRTRCCLRNVVSAKEHHCSALC